jgi:hypothetical protein
MKRVWVVPLGEQLELLVSWLQPMLRRPGLTAAEELRIVVANASVDEERETVAFEPFDALVGPVRFAEAGVVADVIPLEPFEELRSRIGAAGAFRPQVVFATADGTQSYEQIEAIASEAIYVDRVAVVDLT